MTMTQGYYITPAKLRRVKAAAKFAGRSVTWQSVAARPDTVDAFLAKVEPAMKAAKKAKKNPVRKKRAKKKVTRKKRAKKNPKSKLWQIALYEPHNHVIHFYGGVSRGKLAFTQMRSKGILLKTKTEAKKIAETVPEFYRKKLKFSVAVVPESMTLPQLRKGLGLPAGKV